MRRILRHRLASADFGSFTYTQNPSAGNGTAGGTLRFAPGANDRGDYAITVAVRDDGDGDINQVLASAKTFVLTVRSETEAPVIKTGVRPRFMPSRQRQASDRKTVI